MTNRILSYEIRHLLRKPSTYIYLLTFFSIALVSMLGTGGYFDGVPDAKGEIKYLNSPIALLTVFNYFNKFFLFLLPAIVGFVIYKDYKNKTHNILYSFPITKKEYLSGKFLSGIFIVILIALSSGLALIIGEFILGTDNPLINTINWKGYIYTYLIWIIPNLIIYGALVFIIVAALRNIYAGFVTVLLIFLIQIILENIFSGYPILMCLFDPFANTAAVYETRYWTITEQNTLTVPATGVVFWNRLIWASIIAVIGCFFYRHFALEQESPFLSLRRKNNKVKIKQSESVKNKILIRDINYSPSTSTQFKTLIKLSNYEFNYIVKSWMFIALIALGICALFFSIIRITNTGDMIMLPTTGLILSIPMFFYTSIIILMTFIFSGMLVHRSKMTLSHELVDSSMTPNWILLCSKNIAIIKLQVILLTLMIIVGAFVQMFNGFYDIELDLYLFHLFMLVFPSLVIWAIFSTFIHSLIPNVYFGIFVLVLFWIGKDQVYRLGMTSHLLRFNSPPQLSYSGMNGFGHILSSHHLVMGYWLAFSFLILIDTYLIWIRGYTFSLSERLKIAINRINNLVVWPTILFSTSLLAIGFKIYKSEKQHISFQTSDDITIDDLHKKFEIYTHSQQPEIVDVKLKLDIYPEKNSFKGEGQYTLVNTSDKTVDTLIIKTGYDELTEYDIPNGRLLEHNTKFKISAYELSHGLQPKDTMLFNFSIKNIKNTPFIKNSGVLDNGTFLRTDILPRIGYTFQETNLTPTDSLASLQNFYATDAHLVNIETTISTNKKQIAIAPGYLKEKWVQEERTFYRYATREKVKFSFSFNSGAYAIQQETYDGVDLSIYHHKPHEHNNVSIMKGLKAALAYNSKNFGPYQHTSASVIEFPLTEGSYATSMANSIPMSETRFIVNNKQQGDKINLSFYVPAHELTHQWWGNQVVPAKTLGATMLTESITEYISLQIYKDFYSVSKGLDFLKLQHLRYLKGRTNESKVEPPLFLVSPQQSYISYGKGAIAFNTLAHLWSEEKLNESLREFLNHWKFRSDAYPTTIDLLEHVKIHLDKNLHYLLEDFFYEKTFYDNEITNVEVEAISDDQFKTSIQYNIRKYRIGAEESSLNMSDYIEIGLVDDNDHVIAIEKVQIKTSQNDIILESSSKPYKVVLDPNYLYIEIDRNDNERDL